MNIGLKLLMLYFREEFNTAKQWMKEEVLHVYMQWLYFIEQSIFTKYNRVFVMSVLRYARMILYATVSMKLTSSELLTNGTSTLSVIFLSGIIFSIFVIIMESKPVEAAKMSPQLRAYKRNQQKRQKRAMESPQEQSERRALQRERQSLESIRKRAKQIQ